ncbi:hypothetical protein HPB50_016735 [Hyalomma asiaticum]|uniref:Uncharacterized protein n=1 Tax=Hyalomma asiaticum TaxID=266040 RepID=A0ACB7SFU1_HYAAI|nr:hypothetical protein HPB50_016735 [Hyalomma asiaticum]
MEILKKKGRVIRAQTTRIINETDDILAKQAPAPDISCAPVEKARRADLESVKISSLSELRSASAMAICSTLQAEDVLTDTADKTRPFMSTTFATKRLESPSHWAASTKHDSASCACAYRRSAEARAVLLPVLKTGWTFLGMGET